MICTRRSHLRFLCGALTAGLARAENVAADFSTYTDSDKERFLTLAKIVSVEDIGHGVTKPVKVGLELNGIKHAGQIQTVDKDMPDFYPKSGGPVPMKDSWRFNVAAYKVDRLLDLKMVPVSVRRTYKTKPAAFTWWVDDVMFEEIGRLKQEAAPPDSEDYARQVALSKVFDELIMNIDRNLANLLITKSWKIVLIDHSRGFTAYHGIRNEANLTRCSKGLMAKMKALTAGQVSTAVGAILTKAEIAGLLARRDLIVDFFDGLAKTKGEGNVLFS
jgi:hypothetical protein